MQILTFMTISVRPAPKLGRRHGFKLIFPGKMRLSVQSFTPSNVAYSACFPVYNRVFLVSIIGEAFIREKQSLTCLIDPNNTCVCGHYEPFHKRSSLERLFVGPASGSLEPAVLARTRNESRRCEVALHRSNVLIHFPTSPRTFCDRNAVFFRHNDHATSTFLKH